MKREIEDGAVSRVQDPREPTIYCKAYQLRLAELHGCTRRPARKYFMLGKATSQRFYPVALLACCSRTKLESKPKSMRRNARMICIPTRYIKGSDRLMATYLIWEVGNEYSVTDQPK